MFKGKLPEKGLTWKHVSMIVLVVWLLTTFVVGERVKAGAIEVKGLGCSLNAKDFQRDVQGLPLNHQAKASSSK